MNMMEGSRMRKFLLCFGLFGFLVLLLGATSVDRYRQRKIGKWNYLATIVSPWEVANSADNNADPDSPTALGAAERTYATVAAAIDANSSYDGQISIYTLPPWTNGIKFRAIGKDGDGAVYTTQIYFGTLGRTGADCELVLAAQLAWIIGTQVSTTADYEMADQVTVTEYDWPFAFTTKSTTGSNRTAETRVDGGGADIMIVVPTSADTLASLLVKVY